MTLSVARCTSSDAEHLTDVINRAFLENPVTTWLSQEMNQNHRPEIFREYFRIFVDHALASGAAEATDDGAGVALWLLPESGPPPDYDERLAEIVDERQLWRFERLDTAMHQAHPQGAEHHHLAFLATTPGNQSRGHGTALVREHHRELDELGFNAYLEASAPRNRQLYERLGYVDTDASIQLPDGPVMWPMLRAPESR